MYQALGSSPDVQFTIAIHRDDPTGHAATGKVSFKEPGQPKVHGDISCLIVVGNEAFATGTISRPGFAAGNIIVMHAVDSGNPSDVAPDLLRFSFEGAIVPAPGQPGCYLPILPPVVVTRGNILVHAADNDAVGGVGVASRPAIY